MPKSPIEVFTFNNVGIRLLSEATNDVIAAASATEEGEIAIVIREPLASSEGREELLYAKGVEDHSMSLYFNAKTNKGEWIYNKSQQGGY